LLKIHTIPDLTLLSKVRMVSTTFPTALAASIIPDPGARLVCSVEVVAASIQHLEEVPMTSMALPMPAPTAAAM
jgi:hypothetical protein